MVLNVINQNNTTTKPLNQNRMSKTQIQNQVIELIKEWVNKGEPLGLSNAQNILDIYEEKLVNFNQNRLNKEQKEIILLGSKEEILNKYTDYDGIIDRSQALIAMQEYAELYYLAKTKKQTFKSE